MHTRDTASPGPRATPAAFGTPSVRGVPEQPGVLDREQSTLLALLRGRRGAPLSFSELKDAGVDFPASVVSELELAGVPLERCVFGLGDARTVGVQLVGAIDHPRAQEPTPRVVAAGPSADARARSGGPRLRRLSVVALVIALTVLVALVAGGPRTATGSGRGRSVESSPGGHRGSRASAGARRAPRRQPSREPTPVSGRLAAQLEAQGHGLLEAGRYAQAVPVLERALAATGESLKDCVQPASESCLTYAYAQYDLGRSLQLAGRADAAVAVLERRVQIYNQQPAVAAELQLARGQAR